MAGLRIWILNFDADEELEDIPSFLRMYPPFDELSDERLQPLLASKGRPAEAEWIRGMLDNHGTSASEVIHATLTSLDADAYLRANGLTDADLAALGDRLLGDRHWATGRWAARC